MFETCKRNTPLHKTGKRAGLNAAGPDLPLYKKRMVKQYTAKNTDEIYLSSFYTFHLLDGRKYIQGVRTSACDSALKFQRLQTTGCGRCTPISQLSLATLMGYIIPHHVATNPIYTISGYVSAVVLFVVIRGLCRNML